MSGHLEWRHAPDAFFTALDPEDLDSLSEDGNAAGEWAIRIAGIDGNGMVVTGTLKELCTFVRGMLGALTEVVDQDSYQRGVS